ncbi:MAG: SMC-Scp complex subunit ScpB, partial [Hyphococcus sp.]
MTRHEAVGAAEEMLDDQDRTRFEGLDARETQEALAQELTDDASEADSVSEEIAQDEDGTGETQPSSEAAPAEPAPEWSEEDIAAHARMTEALLFAAAEPLDAKSIADRLPVGAAIDVIIARLQDDYAGRGVSLRKIDGKWRFVTAPDVAHVLEKEKVTPRRLSRAALETLAIIAYHQPCTRADIEDVRGVQVAKGSLDQLLEIGWVKLRGKRRDV